MTTKEEISKWFDEGVKEGKNFMLIVCDQFDYTDYPVYVPTPFNALHDIERLRKQEMTRVMEVYNLSMDMYDQLNQDRVFNL